MFHRLSHFWLLFLLALPSLLLLANPESKLMAAAEDEVDTEEEAVDVEQDDEGDGDGDTGMTEGDGESEEGEEEGPLIGASPDSDTTVLFTRPIGTSNLELPAGQIVEFLVGFANKGEKELVLDTLEASFRYPMDFTFHIQNFSALGYHRPVQPKQHATLAYSFLPSEAFSGRPFGLTVMLNYHDVEGTPFQEAVFNETVQVVELEEGLDGETFFLYLFLAACVLLMLVLGQQGLASLGRKGGKRLETKPQTKGGVDYDWIPKETLRQLKKTGSPHQSPRQRKAKRGMGSDD